MILASYCEMHQNYAKKNPSVLQWAPKCIRSMILCTILWRHSVTYLAYHDIEKRSYGASYKGALMNSRDGGMNVSDFWYVLQFRRCPTIDSPPLPQPFQVVLRQSVHFYGTTGETSWQPVLVNWKEMSSNNDSWVHYVNLCLELTMSRQPYYSGTSRRTHFVFDSPSSYLNTHWWQHDLDELWVYLP